MKDFFSRLKIAIDDEESYWESIGIMSELIEHEFRSNEEEPATQLMCIRGLLILLINEHLADFSGQGFCERIMSTFLDVISGEITNEKMEITD